jgi:ABC-type multidrug transport system fused ATPase/permease subunit
MEHGSKTNLIFFPIADIISSDLGFIIFYGGIKILNGDNFTTFGDLFSYTMFIAMLFNPLRQIADKFNEMHRNDCR